MLSLKVVGPILSTAGSVVLAWRVKTLLGALVLAQLEVQTNVLAIQAMLAGKTPHLIIADGTDRYVEQSQRRGVWLLVMGFLLLAAGAAISAYLAWHALITA